MTVALDTADTDSVESDVAPASWTARAGAIGIDAVTPVVVAYVIGATAYLFRSPWWVYAAVASLGVVVVGVNRWLLPALTGWSWGRSVFAIAVQRAADGAPAGVGRLVLRDLAHLLDTAALLVGWLWPLWDSRHRTFADMLLRTEVRVVDAPEGVSRAARRRAALVLVGAALVCAVGAGAGVFQFRENRAIDQTRQHISEEGPRIVEKVLSYGADTYKDDFATAQKLVTDSYRDQLVRQQQDLVRRGGLASNDYWAVSSAVLSAQPDKATMLIALQGQRGGDPRTLKFITATVRVNFVKAHDGHWQLADLTVLKRPAQPAQQISPPPAPQAPQAPKAPAGGTR